MTISHRIDTPIIQSRFSHDLVCLLWGKQAQPYFDAMGCNWLNGGCHTLARAILQYLVPNDYVSSLAAIMDEDEDMWELYSVHHVVVEIRLDRENWYIDANGVQTSRELIAFWQERKGKRLVIENCLTSLDDLAWLEDEVPSLAEHVDPLANLLIESLGRCPL